MLLEIHMSVRNADASFTTSSCAVAKCLHANFQIDYSSSNVYEFFFVLEGRGPSSYVLPPSRKKLRGGVFAETPLTFFT
jgi:hypothetical protein